MQSFFRSTFAIGTIGLIVFVSLMSGCSQTSEDSPAGVATEALIIEAADAGVDVMDMWLQYEVCKGRWH